MDVTLMRGRFSKSVLGLALIRGSLHARVFKGKEVVASWDAAGPLAGIDGLREALEQVPEQTGFHGESVVVAIASSQMEHQTVKMPPMRDRDMEAFLSRKVRHFAIEGGRQAWSWHVLHGGRTEQQVALHLLPLPLMHVFLDFCRSHSYQVEQVAPLTSALGWSARDLPLQTDQWGLVAAELGSATSLVIANPEGKLALVRELSFGLTDSDSADRLSKELNRSILFAKQQFGITVSGVWISGMSLQEAPLSLARSVSDAPVSPLPTPDPAAFWLQPLTRLDPDSHDNMVPRPMRRLNERRRHLELVMAFAIGLHALVAVAIFGLRIAAEQTQKSVDRAHLEERSIALRREKTELESRAGAIAELEMQAVGVKAASWDPKPGWLLGWIATRIPDDLRLASAKITRSIDSGNWQVQLTGTAPREPVRAARALREFQDSLQKGAPRLAISKPWESQWETNLRVGATWEADSLGKPFTIEGAIR